MEKTDNFLQCFALWICLNYNRYFSGQRHWISCTHTACFKVYTNFFWWHMICLEVIFTTAIQLFACGCVVLHQSSFMGFPSKTALNVSAVTLLSCVDVFGCRQPCCDAFEAFVGSLQKYSAIARMLLSFYCPRDRLASAVCLQGAFRRSSESALFYILSHVLWLLCWWCSNRM